MKSAFSSAILSLASLYAIQAAAQENIGTSQQPLTSAREIHIINEGDQTLSFSLKADNGDWSNESIDGGDDMLYRCDGCNNDHFVIAIRTGDTRKRYRLDYGQRYALYWNDNGYWDVQEITDQ